MRWVTRGRLRRGRTRLGAVKWVQPPHTAPGNRGHPRYHHTPPTHRPRRAAPAAPQAPPWARGGRGDSGGRGDRGGSARAMCWLSTTPPGPFRGRGGGGGVGLRGPPPGALQPLLNPCSHWRGSQNSSRNGTARPGDRAQMPTGSRGHPPTTPRQPDPLSLPTSPHSGCAPPPALGVAGVKRGLERTTRPHHGPHHHQAWEALGGLEDADGGRGGPSRPPTRLGVPGRWVAPGRGAPACQRHGGERGPPPRRASHCR